MAPEVWLLAVHHRHGDDTTVYASEEAAQGGLFEYVMQCWTEIAGNEYTASSGELACVPEEVPTEPGAAVGIYFHVQKDEWYEISEKQVNA